MTEDNKSTPAKPVWKRRWFLASSIAAVVFAVILVVLPFIIGNLMKSWLLENGADNVTIENIDFNPFTGTAAVHGLDIRIGDKPVVTDALVHLDISLSSLLKKGIAVEAATIDKLEIDIEQTTDGKIRIGSLILDLNKKPKKNIDRKVKQELAWWLSLDNINLNDSVIHYKSPQIKTTLFLDKISLQNLSTRSGKQSAKLDIRARLKKSNINVALHLEQLRPGVIAGGDISIKNIDLADFSGFTADSLAGTFNLSGKFSAITSSDNSIDASYSGKTVISNTHLSNKDFAVTGTDINLDGTLSFKAQAGRSQQAIKLDGKLGASNYTAKLAGLDISGKEFNWQGLLDYTRAEAADSQDINMSGKLNAKDVSLVLAGQNLSIKQKDINLNPQLSVKISGSSTKINGATNLQASGTQIEDTVKSLTLLAINTLDVDGVRIISQDTVKINSIVIQDTGLIQKNNSKQPAISIGSSTLTDVNYDGSGVAIQTVTFDKLSGDFVREKDGTIDLGNELKPAEKPNKQSISNEKSAKETRPDTEKTSSDRTFGIKISELNVKGNSKLQFTDKTVSPAFKSVLDIASLKFTDIDNSKPDQAIALKLDGKLNNYATLAIDGSVKPFRKQLGLKIKARLGNQNMVALSPYMASATGYQIHSGQLNIDSDIVIENGNIDAKNTVIMKKLKIEEADKNLAKENAGSIGMPLDKALGMLQDKNNNIKLDLPITGKLEDVDIGTGQIINTALKKATTAGMKTYLLYAFQPYGALIIAGQAVGKQVGKITLDPVFFKAGESTLTSKHKDYLGKLGKVMLDRPKIDVQVCAYATIADLSIKKNSAKDKSTAALSERQIKKSLKLGQERQKIIKDFLISKYKISDGRLILCAPEYDDSKEARSRVELLI